MLMQGHGLRSSLRYSLTCDRRDSETLPSDGYILQSNSELCGIGVSPGIVQALKQEIAAEMHIPISSIIGFSFSARAGAILPLGSSSQPSCIADRFFLGGIDSMRGFSIKGLGPSDERRVLPEKGEFDTDTVTFDKDSLGGDFMGMHHYCCAHTFFQSSIVIRKLIRG